MSAQPGTRGGHSLFGRWLYSVLWIVCRALGVSVFGVRTRFAEPLPERGGLIVLSSHQSHLDPLLLGLACDRRLSSLARSSLYAFKPFGAVITALDAIPIDREASALVAMKTVIRRLEEGAATGRVACVIRSVRISPDTSRPSTSTAPSVNTIWIDSASSASLAASSSGTPRSSATSATARYIAPVSM